MPDTKKSHRLSTRTMLLVLGLFGAVGLLGFFNRTQKETVTWQTDFPSATTRSVSEKRPMFLYFTATWCPPCKEMRRTTWTDERVGAALKDYLAVKIDVDDQPKIAEEFEANSIPTLIIMEGERQVARREGYLSASDLVQWIENNRKSENWTVPDPATVPVSERE